MTTGPPTARPGSRSLRDALLPSHPGNPGPHVRAAHAVLAPALALALALALAVAAAVPVDPSGAASLAVSTSTSFPPLLPTSLTTAGGTWATLPMGRLDQPLNTFWQLLYLPQSGARWADRVSALGVATSGGITIASAGGADLYAATAPSEQLAFSPVVRTTGRGWADEPPAPGRAVALAATTGRPLVALVAGRSGTRLVAAPATPSSASWATVLTAGRLARTPAGSTCRPTRLTAVSYDAAGDLVVGADCARRGVVGLFTGRGGRWRGAAVDLPAGHPGKVAGVVALRSAGRRVLAVLRLAGVGRTDLVAAWSPATTTITSSPAAVGAWQASPPLVVGASASVASTGPAGPGGRGTFVLVRPGGSEPARLAWLRGPGATWQVAPRPPRGTATVAFPPSGAVLALAPHAGTLAAWRLGPGSAGWRQQQALHVDLVYGSSQ